jgi:hypothetical protein
MIHQYYSFNIETQKIYVMTHEYYSINISTQKLYCMTHQWYSFNIKMQKLYQMTQHYYCLNNKTQKFIEWDINTTISIIKRNSWYRTTLQHYKILKRYKWFRTAHHNIECTNKIIENKMHVHVCFICNIYIIVYTYWLGMRE